VQVYGQELDYHDLIRRIKSVQRGSKRLGFLLDHVSLDDVSFVQVRQPADRDATLEILLDFLHVVLEPFERGDLPLKITSSPRKTRTNALLVIDPSIT